jgi:hypothetical protein
MSVANRKKQKSSTTKIRTKSCKYYRAQAKKQNQTPKIPKHSWEIVKHYWNLIISRREKINEKCLIKKNKKNLKMIL